MCQLLSEQTTLTPEIWRNLGFHVSGFKKAGFNETSASIEGSIRIQPIRKEDCIAEYVHACLLCIIGRFRKPDILTETASPFLIPAAGLHCLGEGTSISQIRTCISRFVKPKSDRGGLSDLCHVPSRTFHSSTAKFWRLLDAGHMAATHGGELLVFHDQLGAGKT